MRGRRKMKCRICGEELSGTEKFCPQCGKEITQYCTECGAELPLSAKFCSSCGMPTDGKNIEKKNEDNLLNRDRVSIKENKIEESSTIEKDIVLEENLNIEKEDIESLKENQEVLSLQDALEEKQDETENDSGGQMKVGISVVSKTKENFEGELKRLAQQDKESKYVLDYYGEEVFIKHVFPLLNNGEKILKIRRINHHNYANIFIRVGIINTRFLLITTERVIKFVKSFGLKAKIKSYYLSEIVSIEDTKPGSQLHGVLIGEKLRINSNKKQVTFRTIGSGSAYQFKLDILQAMSIGHIKMAFVEKKEQDEIELKDLRYKVGFKWALLVAFIAFFMPFCTVSCGRQVLLSSNGYELTGTWGMTSEQMKTLEVAPADTGNYIIVIILILMILAVIIVNGKIIKTAQTGIAAFILFIFSQDQGWDGIRNIGCQVKFEYGYYLALIFLILAATAFLWAPVIVEKLEEFFISNRNNVTGNRKASQFLKKVNISLFCMLVAVMATAAYTYQDSLGAWKEILYNWDKVPDLKDNLSPDLESEWWDDEWWDELFEDEG